MPYYLFAWIASLAYALETIAGKLIGTQEVRNPYLFNFLWSFFILLLTLPFALSNHVTLPVAWGNIMPAALLYAASGILYLTVLQKLDISIITPLLNLRVILSVMLGVFFLGESYSFSSYLLMAMAVLAGFFVALDEKFSFRSFFRKGILLLILEIFVLSFFYFFIGKAVGETGFWEASLWVDILAQLFLLLTFPFFCKDWRQLKIGNVGGIWMMAIFGVVGVLSANKAVSENMGISNLILSLPLSMVIVILLALFFPKKAQVLEKHTLKVYGIRLLAAAVMLAATLKLTLF